MGNKSLIRPQKLIRTLNLATWHTSTYTEYRQANKDNKQQGPLDQNASLPFMRNIWWRFFDKLGTLSYLHGPFNLFDFLQLAGTWRPLVYLINILFYLMFVFRALA